MKNIKKKILFNHFRNKSKRNNGMQFSQQNRAFGA